MLTTQNHIRTRPHDAALAAGVNSRRIASKVVQLLIDCDNGLVDCRAIARDCAPIESDILTEIIAAIADGGLYPDTEYR